MREWQWVCFESAPNSAFALAVTDDVCLAATDEGLWQLDWQRARWEPVAPLIRQVRLNAVAVASSRLIVASESEIAFSEDHGETWQLARIPISGGIMGLALSPQFENDGLGVAATARDGVWRTSDGGISWFAWNHSLLDLCVNAVLISPNFAIDERVFAATDYGVFISENTGQAWRDLWMTNGETPFTALALDDERLLVGSEGGGVWIASPPFIETTRLLDGEVINALLPHLAVTASGIYEMVNGSARQVSDLDSGICVAQLPDGSVLVGTVGDGLWRGVPRER